MSIHLKVTQIGNSLGVILPKEALATLKVEKGDTLFLSEAPGGFRITPYDPNVAHQLEAGREFSKEYRDTLRALAK
jgi:putative addiction module antidote